MVSFFSSVVAARWVARLHSQLIHALRIIVEFRLTFRASNCPPAAQRKERGGKLIIGVRVRAATVSPATAAGASGDCRAADWDFSERTAPGYATGPGRSACPGSS